ncbi:MAG: ParM/StbA family protein [Candidatus Heimdallarchaeota archaeon]|nr:ParM/StbA family protein [Candidatus Heimdallarchaeota archaeon]
MSLRPTYRAIGIDLGTSTVKLSCAQHLKKIPSIVGSPLEGWRGFSGDSSLEKNLVIHDGDKRLYIGELARLQSEIKREIASEGKVKSIEDAILAIKASLALISERDFDQVIIATGVPVASSKKEMVKLAKGLKGTLEIKVENEATGDIFERKLNIERCIVMPEPFGTYYYTLKNEGENRAVDAIVIDVGHGSTDILTLYEGRVMRQASGSIEEATDTLTHRIAQELQNQTGKILRPFDLMAALSQQKDVLTIAGERWDILGMKEYHVEIISDVILDEVNRLIGTLPPDAIIEKVIFCGGGVHIFGDRLRAGFEQAGLAEHPEMLVIPDDPVMSNAMGFELFARTYVKSLGDDKINEL